MRGTTQIDSLTVTHQEVSGAIAQLGERLPCTQEVGGSIPPGSTNKKKGCKCIPFFCSFFCSFLLVLWLLGTVLLAAKNQQVVILFTFLNHKKPTEKSCLRT